MDNFAFFCQIQEIPDNLTVFEELKNKQLFFPIFKLIKTIIYFFMDKNRLISSFCINPSMLFKS